MHHAANFKQEEIQIRPRANFPGPVAVGPGTNNVTKAVAVGPGANNYLEELAALWIAIVVDRLCLPEKRILH